MSTLLLRRWRPQYRNPLYLLIFVGLVFGGRAVAQIDVGASFDCPLGSCDANTSDEGGDHHNVVLAEHLAEARASGNGAAERSAFAEVGVRFRPCFTGPVRLGMHDIDIDGRLRGFGGGPVIRGDVNVRTILRDVTDGIELHNEVVFEEEERGNVGVTVNHDISVNRESFVTETVTENHTYDFVVRVNARKFGLNGMSDFQQGGRGVSFDRVSLVPQLEDTDGDGLFDQWEISGIDEDCDAIVEVDLPQMGADPTIKDVFLELDWMTGEAPTQAAVRAVVNAFALAPGTAGGTNTPGQGINLWVDTGDLTDPTASEDDAGPNTCGDGFDNMLDGAEDQLDPDCLVGALAFSSLGADLGGGNGFPVSGVPDMFNDADVDGETDFEEAKFDPGRGNFDPARLRVFRYAINAVPAGPPPNMGGQALHNDFVLFNQNAGLLMHELGHTLGLGHGGPYDDVEGGDDEVNCKPNYLSVMNYRFQGGIQVSGGLGNGQDIDGDGTPDGFILDYSPPRFSTGPGTFGRNAALAAVDETAWSEAVVQDVGDAANISAWTIANQSLFTGMVNAPPDWNGDGDTNDQAPPSIDFNTSAWTPNAAEGTGTCSDGMDHDLDGLTDINDPDCIVNQRCGLASNASVQQYNGANDWDNLDLDPNRYAQADSGDIPGWNDEPGLDDIRRLQAAMQTTDIAAVAKEADVDPVAAGQPLNYTITVENLGPRATTEVILTDLLSPDLHFLDGEPSCEEANDDVVCAVGGLDPGDSRDVTINTRVSVDLACAPGEQFTELVNLAETTNLGGPDSDPSNDTVQLTSSALCARYEYAAKYVCGRQSSRDDPRLSIGEYKTTVNVHNPNDEDVFFFKKVALAFPPAEQAPGDVIPIAIDQLAYDEALKVDCAEVREALEASPQDYVEGYVIVQSPLSLDVDAVYTTEVRDDDGRVVSSSLDVEAVDERERRRTADLEVTKNVTTATIAEYQVEGPQPVRFAYHLALYAIQLTNNGPDTAHNVVLNDALSVNATNGLGAAAIFPEPMTLPEGAEVTDLEFVGPHLSTMTIAIGDLEPEAAVEVAFWALALTVVIGDGDPHIELLDKVSTGSIAAEIAPGNNSVEVVSVLVP